MDDQCKEDAPLVLLVDDDPMIRLLVRESLQQKGFAVEEAENGNVALGVLESCQPDVILLSTLR